jgi:hypothetical protein
MLFWRPRMAATLSVPILGTRAQRLQQERSDELLTLPVHPTRARLLANDHNNADELEITLDWTEAGVDPRLLDDAVVTFYMDVADDYGRWSPTEQNCRFIGLVRDVNAEREVGSPATVSILALDYTTLFLRAKPFGSSGVPELKSTLSEAWRKIVSQTPGAEILADRLVLRGVNGDPVLGEAVSDRFRKLASVPTHPETDAWAVWQQCCGMLGLISWIDKDECVVSTATNLYTEQDPPRLIWGRNLLRWHEERSVGPAGKDVGVTSFDPLTGTTLEAFWRPKGQATTKRAKAAKVGGGQEATHEEKREWYPVPGVTSQAKLDEIAKRIHEERSRQELSGRAITAEWSAETFDGKTFDLVGLKAGDSVQVTVDAKDRQLLSSLDSPQAQREYLEQRGYTTQVAQLIVSNLENLATLSSVYITKTVATELEFSGDGGQFRVELEYINRIDLDGTI